MFLNTNGTFSGLTKRLVAEFSGRVPEFYLVVSIEGDKEIHRRIRGTDSYNLAVKTLVECRNLGRKGYHQIISTTLQKANSGYETLDHIRDLAIATESTFTFRFADKNDNYYDNVDLPNLTLSTGQVKKILSFIERNFGEDLFLRHQKEFYETGKTPLMQDEDGNLLCRAGELFVFVKSNGKIYPCIYSSREIGNTEEGITRKLEDLGRHEPCPCCTECHFYPMLTYTNKPL